jgi:hypothetical protein
MNVSCHLMVPERDSDGRAFHRPLESIFLVYHMMDAFEQPAYDLEGCCVGWFWLAVEPLTEASPG